MLDMKSVLQNAWNDSIDSFISEVRRLCILPAFRSLALSFNVKSSDLYKTVHRCENLCPYRFADYNPNVCFEDYQYEDQVNRSSKRLHRLIEVISQCGPTVRPIPSHIFFVKKAFDLSLESAMVDSFNCTAFRFLFPRVFSTKDLLRTDSPISLENANNLLNAGLFLCIDSIPRNAFAFPEYMALSCLYLSVRGQTLLTLNKSFATPKQKTQAKKRFRAISNTLFSQEYAASVIETTFDILSRHIEKEYRALLELHIREFWIKDGFQNLINLDHAYDRHASTEPLLPPDPLDRYTELVFAYVKNEHPELAEQIYRASNATPIIALFDEELASVLCSKADCEPSGIRQKYSEQFELLQLYSRFYNIICPTAELLVLGYLPLMDNLPGSEVDLLPFIMKSTVSPRIKESLSSYSHYLITAKEYYSAKDLSALLTYYFGEAQRATATLLSCLAEADVAKSKNFFEYLQELHTDN